MLTVPRELGLPVVGTLAAPKLAPSILVFKVGHSPVPTLRKFALVLQELITKICPTWRGLLRFALAEGRTGGGGAYCKSHT